MVVLIIRGRISKGDLKKDRLTKFQFDLKSGKMIFHMGELDQF